MDTNICRRQNYLQQKILDRVLHHSHIINIQGDSYRLKEKKIKDY